LAILDGDSGHCSYINIFYSCLYFIDPAEGLQILLFFIRLWAIGMFYGMGFRYKMISKTGKKIDKSQPYVIISNHTSIMDVMLPCILFPNHPLCYVGKKSWKKSQSLEPFIKGFV
jgi:1-acyl-sn-glycerol-3-phosphate acyltransferase